jgi:hypothetical protein
MQLHDGEIRSTTFGKAGLGAPSFGLRRPGCKSDGEASNGKDAKKRESVALHFQYRLLNYQNHFLNLFSMISNASHDLKTTIVQPFATLRPAPDEEDGVGDASVDEFALVLPAGLAPTHEDADLAATPVRLEAGIACWLDIAGQAHQIGTVDSPLDAEIQAALRRPDGLLTIFMEPSSGTHAGFALFQAIDGHNDHPGDRK